MNLGELAARVCSHLESRGIVPHGIGFLASTWKNMGYMHQFGAESGACKYMK